MPGFKAEKGLGRRLLDLQLSFAREAGYVWDEDKGYFIEYIVNELMKRERIIQNVKDGIKAIKGES